MNIIHRINALTQMRFFKYCLWKASSLFFPYHMILHRKFLNGCQRDLPDELRTIIKDPFGHCTNVIANTNEIGDRISTLRYYVFRSKCKVLAATSSFPLENVCKFPPYYMQDIWVCVKLETPKTTLKLQ